ncbi:MAG: GGDEF domain-containing protein [Lachnospiraceae bacterium]|nr:GGDEF domain-containing protein [Lachnospiraceae bacterium]
MRIYGLSEYILSFFPVLLCVIGLLLVILFNRGAQQITKKYLIISNVDLLLLTIIEYLNIWGQNEDGGKTMLTVTMILVYALQSVPIFMMVLCLRGPKPRSWIFSIPLVLNVFFVSTALFEPLVFSYDDEGKFVRGSLFFVPYTFMVIYIAILAYYTFKMVGRSYAMEALIVVFVLLAVMTSAALEIFAGMMSFVCQALAVGNLLYYLYIHVQGEARDHLTMLLNRSSFYQDVRKKRSKIKGLILVDMNELRWINDNIGYDKGDRMLSSLAEFLSDHLGREYPLYRVCGDEFAALVLEEDRKEVEAMAVQLKDALKQHNFSVSLAVAFTEDIKEKRGKIDSLLNLAENEVYKEKCYMREHGLVRHRDESA